MTQTSSSQNPSCQPTGQFYVLQQALDFYEQGRVNVAVDLWSSLPDEFRVCCLQCVLELRNYQHRLWTVPDLVGKSRWGTLVLSEKFAIQMLHHVAAISSVFLASRTV